MKIAIGQIQSVEGEIRVNVEKHLEVARVCAPRDVDLIVFPELSVTGYVPSLCREMAMTPDDELLEPFQRYADDHDLAIAVGFPIKSDSLPYIGLIMFRPYRSPFVQLKKDLHTSEDEFFLPGNGSDLVSIGGTEVAFGICYEARLPENARRAAELGAKVFIASSVNSASDIERVQTYYPKSAKEHNLTVILSNTVGECGGYPSSGTSSAWDPSGQLRGELSDSAEGILIYDTATKEVQIFEV